MGIIEQMKKAKADGSTETVERLLKVVQSYPYVSDKTVRKLKRIANA